MEQLDDQHNLHYQLDTREKVNQFRNSNKPPQTSNSKVCSFYSSYGFCKFGQNCKFLHRRKYSTNKPVQRKYVPLKNDASLKLPQKVEKGANSSEYNFNGTTHKKFQKRTCRYHKAGQCDKGENCLYSHDLDTFNLNADVTVPKNRKDNLTKGIKTAASKKKSIPVCHYFGRGSCQKGEQCKYYHNPKYQKEHLNISSDINENNLSDVQTNDNRDVFDQKSIECEALISSHSDSINSENFNGTTHKNFQNRTCRYYKAGQCDKGENCLYSHDLDTYNLNTDVTVPKNRKDNLTKGIKTAASKKKSIPACHYFRHGSCQKGDQCKYYHNPKYQKEHLNISSDINENNLSDVQTNYYGDVFDQKSTECEALISSHSDSINSENVESLIPSSSKLLANHESSETLQESKLLNTNAIHDVTTNNHINIRIQIPQNARTFNLTTLSEESLFHLRNTEITQLKKRFPKLDENGSSFTFDFEPTDPDWPFETKSLHLQVIFPESYPLEVCDISVVSHMNYMPGILLRHLNQSICNWLLEKHTAAIEQNQVILLFRPFLKWFDKNLEELFNFGLKKVSEDKGVQNSVNESALPENNSLLSCENNLGSDLSEQESLLPSTNASAEADSGKETNHSPPRQKTEPTVLSNSQMQGSKVIFTGLELVEGVAALSCKKLAVTVHCSRCKTSFNKILIPNKNTQMVCSKCSRRMEFNFNPSILHQFSSVLGTIYLMECQAVDVNLVECAFLVDCLSCSKQVSVDGLHYGQKQKLWCKFCNQKLIVGIDGVKFQASAATNVTASNKTVTVKKVTKIKDPVIKEGCPLPNYGACKHYKKSYRWLRFPCCGRLYPCDLCHDEKEADHDMKYASRMVCGFCSKEQPYSKEKPCFGCSANMTKKSGSYWEGGQGCRNSVTMSRKDVHKYAGMSKTTSKKSQPAAKKKK